VTERGITARDDHASAFSVPKRAATSPRRGIGRAPLAGGIGRAPLAGGIGRAPLAGGIGRAPLAGGIGRAPLARNGVVKNPRARPRLKWTHSRHAARSRQAQSLQSTASDFVQAGRVSR